VELILQVKYENTKINNKGIVKGIVNMEFDINALVNAVVNKVESKNRPKKEFMSSKAFKFEAPNKKEGEDKVTYIIKLLPWTKDGEYNKTFTYRYQYRWQGMPEPGQAKGKWNYVTSAGNFGEDCPINEWRNEFLAANTGNSEEIKRVLKPLNRNDARIMNILVVDDPKKPENNGKVFPLEVNVPMWNVIEKGIRGEFDQDFTEARGSVVKVKDKMFDLSPNGMNLKVNVVLNQMGIANYECAFCFTKVDLFGDNGIKPCADDKVKMLEEEITLKELVEQRIQDDMVDTLEYVKEGIRPYDDVKKLFVKTFLSNPKISMHVSAKWMSDEGKEKVAPKVVKSEPKYENTEVEDDYDLDDAGEIPTFSESNDMDDFMAELEAEQGL
jgi:hypothetical protein